MRTLLPAFAALLSVRQQARNWMRAVFISPPKVGYVGQLDVPSPTATPKTISCQLAKTTPTICDANRIDVAWRDLAPAAPTLLSHGDISIKDDGEPEFGFKRVMDTNFGTLSGCDVATCIIDPEIMSEGPSGILADKVTLQVKAATGKVYQDVAIPVAAGSSIASQTWTFSIWVHRVAGTTAAQTFNLKLCIINGTTESQEPSPAPLLT